jgi:acyl-CoA hydrolase
MNIAVPNTVLPDQTRFVDMIFPGHANPYGTLFGGTALNMMGTAAACGASEMAAVNADGCPVRIPQPDKIRQTDKDTES